MIEAAAKIGRSGRDESTQAAVGLVDRWIRAAVISRLSRLHGGQLRLVEDGKEQVFGQPADDGLSAEAHVLDARCFRHLLFGGSLGAAEAFIRGHWTTPDLTTLVRLFCRNLDSRSPDSGLARLGGWAARLWHLLRGNTRRGSRRNIAAHYDLGNEFFATFLDPTMAYSCAVFPRADADLVEASLAKFDRIAAKLNLHEGDTVLEIGTGWGGFAIHAASRYGCRVVTTTISAAQYAYASSQVDRAGLGDRVRVLDRDYRDLDGTFDKLVSIEMIEAVGRQYLDTFFAACSQRLKPDGRMLLQAIVMPDQRYRQYCRGTDFIQRYVFPGGHLPSLGAICDSVGRATDMQIVSLEDLTPHYAETLAHWRRNFRDQIDAVRAQGFDDSFLRLWEYYLCYCEAGFRERVIGCVQIVLDKPQRARSIELPRWPQ